MRRDDMCCTVCGSTEGVFEYHCAGYDINRDDNSNMPDYGGMDYPVEYIWCQTCDDETDIEQHEDWCERNSEDNEK